MASDVSADYDADVSPGSPSAAAAMELTPRRVADPAAAETEVQEMEVDDKRDQDGLKETSGEKVPPGNESTPFRPERVKRALKFSKTFEDFRKTRKFRVLHLFSGPNDPLGQAIKIEAAKNRLEVDVTALDKKVDNSVDLSKAKNFEPILKMVESGEFDYYHAGFPCGSFSRARHNPKEGLPGPVRSKEHIYGCPGNSKQQQAEADRGTMMATQSAKVYEAQVNSARKRHTPPLATLENPPGDNVSGSAWDLGEVESALSRTEGKRVDYNTCAFQTKERERFYKPGVWAGRLDNITKLQKVCRCPAWVKHTVLSGKEKTEKSAEYTQELSQTVAVEVVSVWKKILNLEWWRWVAETKSQEVDKLRKAWLENENKKQRGDEKRAEPSKRAASMAFKIGNIEEDEIPSGAQGVPTKKLKEDHNKACIGGMRNPAQAVKRLSLVRHTGRRIWAMWKDFIESHESALDVAINYGRTDNKFDDELVKEWKSALLDNFAKVPEENKTAIIRENYEYRSPLDAELWEAWMMEAKDPDRDIPDFIRRGVPMGMEVKIPPSNVFPAVVEDGDHTDEPAEEFEQLRWTRNYSSVREQQGEATLEIQRYIEKGYAIRTSWRWIEETLGPAGTVSKMALILKEKEDGSIKRRIILDMRRSQGNLRAQVDERIVLPRIQDVLDSVRELWETKHQQGEYGSNDRQDYFEFYLIDLADAFTHFGIRKEELKHCITPSEAEDDTAILWRAMLFGYKAAPLLMGRLSSAIGRLCQSICDPKLTQFQIYVDDLLVASLGSRAWRDTQFSAVLYTLAALGVQVNLKKGERGTRVQWIGCTIEVPEANSTRQEEQVMVLGLSQQMVNQVVETLKSWRTAGMGSVKDLRTLTGRMSWIGGVLPRLRWTVNILYAVLRDVDKEQRDGTEERRAEGRQDPRAKVGLFPIKRLGGVHFWLLKLFERPAEMLVREEKLHKPKVTWGIITDASPKGWGAILVQVEDGVHRRLKPMSALEGIISEEEAKLLEVEYGESSSQAVMEAYAILRAIAVWPLKLQGQAILIRSDSSVVLGMMRKLSSPHKSLNFIASEIALRLEKYRVQRVVLHHLRGSLNVEADWLSRILERNPNDMPEGLSGVRLTRLGPWKADKFWLTPPGGDPSKPDRLSFGQSVLEHLK